MAEGLFGYNLSNPALPRVIKLATGYYWQDNTHLEITLRQGVMFHDGAIFNSTSAKWNFDRIMYLTNASGTLPVTSSIAQPASLYFFNITYNNDGVMNGGTPIIKSVTDVGEWNLTIVLNAPYAPFLDLLCFEASFMVSPKSTPADRFLNLDEKLVGTGPFTFDYYTPYVEVDFHAFDDYWQGEANITKMVFSIISDSVTRNYAMLNHDIDYLISPIHSLMPTFEADPSITVKHFTDDTGIPGLPYYYLGFNNVLINQTMRKAISYAINYSYIIDQMQSGLVVRANSPISPGYGERFNSSVKAATYNLAKARQVLLDNIPELGSLGLIADNSTTGSNANAWKALNLVSFNYTYNTETSFRVFLYAPLHDWLSQIGIDVVDDGIAWDSFFNALYVHHDRLGLYWYGWDPDYLDPLNMLDPLFNPAFTSDSAQVNDSTLNTLMHLALQATDDVARNDIYKHIQYYLANVLYPHAFGYYPKITIVHSANLTNVPYNALGKLYFYPCNWIPKQDSIAPIVIINDPGTGEFCGASSPEYDIAITEYNLDSMWYTLDDGMNNITIVSPTGTLDATAWDMLPDGPVTITFYANDTNDNIGSAQVTIIKDTTAPVIVINQPQTGDLFTTNIPLYNITITGENLQSVWYTMNGGLNFTVITDFAGFLNETIWKTLPNGPITLTFYANDTVGNSGSDTVIIYKNVPSPSPQIVPGINPILLYTIVILGIAIVILSIKQKRKIK